MAIDDDQDLVANFRASILWKFVPRNYDWVALDKDGMVYMYEDEPDIAWPNGEWFLLEAGSEAMPIKVTDERLLEIWDSAWARRPDVKES